MAIRAEQVLMAGVVGLGIYALYRLSRTSSAAAQTTQGSNTNIGPRVDPNAPPLPDAPGPVTPPANLLYATGPDPNRPLATMHVANSRAYRGRGENLTRADLGFLDAVRFYETPAEARADATPEWALQNASKNTRWFYGRYLGPDADYAKPRAIAFMWAVPGPPPRVAGVPYVHAAPFRAANPRVLF